MNRSLHDYPFIYISFQVNLFISNIPDVHSPNKSGNVNEKRVIPNIFPNAYSPSKTKCHMVFILCIVQCGCKTSIRTEESTWIIFVWILTKQFRIIVDGPDIRDNNRPLWNVVPLVSVMLICLIFSMDKL